LKPTFQSLCDACGSSSPLFGFQRLSPTAYPDYQPARTAAWGRVDYLLSRKVQAKSVEGQSAKPCFRKLVRDPLPVVFHLSKAGKAPKIPPPRWIQRLRL